NAAVPSADFTVTMRAAPSLVAVGNDLTYTIIVTNNGPDAATGFTLTDLLPGTVTLRSVTPTQGICEVPDISTVSCRLRTVANGGSATVTIVVTPTQVGRITNSASGRAIVTNPNSANNTATVTTTVINPAVSADLAVAISAAPSVTLGDNLTYTITVTNNGL